MIKYSVLATFISIFISLIIAYLYQQATIASPLFASGITALFIVYLFAYKEKRLLEKKEKLIFITIYGVLILVMHLLLAMMAENLTPSGLATFIVMAITYPAIMSIIFTNKQIEHRLSKNA